MTDSFDRAFRAAARRSRPAGVCPEAAMLASYADNGLSEDERRSVEAHVADCATCLEHMALLGAVSLEREAPEPSGWWLAQWRWLVPVATAVLVVAVWMRLPEQMNQEVVIKPTPAMQAPPSVSTDEERVAPASPPAERESNAAARDAAKVTEAAPARAAQLSDKKTDQLTPLERRDNARQKAANAPPPAVVAAPEATPPSQAKEAAAEKVRIVGATSRVAASPPAAAAPRAPEAIREEAQAADAGQRREADRLMSKAAAPVLVVSASAKESYRAAGNQIELSEDGGGNWRAVLSRAPGIFTAAGCLPNGPCWFGAADGQIWRRTPNGFSSFALPVRQRVIAITVESAQTVVVTVEGGQRFRTANGGANWASIP